MRRTVQRVSASTPQCLVSFTAQHAWGLLPEAGLPSISPYRADIVRFATQACFSGASGSRSSINSPGRATVVDHITNPTLSSNRAQAASSRPTQTPQNRYYGRSTTDCSKTNPPISSIGPGVRAYRTPPSVQPSIAATLTPDTATSHCSAISPWNRRQTLEMSIRPTSLSPDFVAADLGGHNTRALHTTTLKGASGGTTGDGSFSEGAPRFDHGTASERDTYEVVSEYYGRVLATSKDLKTGACTASGAPPLAIRKIMSLIPAEVMDKFYGCGAPLPQGIDGLTVLDLGSGSGRDCYVAAALVGESGRVIGIDMTDEQIQVAERSAEGFCREQLGYKACNMRYVKGHIEYLDRAGIADESVDIILSNCVVNLSPDKARVLSEAYRVLKPGGEFFFSDVYADRRVPEAAQKDEVLWGECVSGALYINDFMTLARQVGFADPRQLQKEVVPINDDTIADLVGNIKFYSITYRLFKLPGLLETASEDYGQLVTYKGTIPGHRHTYSLDENLVLETGRPARVSGNTAAMVGEGGVSWLSPHFQVTGDRKVHYGEFSDGNGVPIDAVDSAPLATSTKPAASCCG